MAEFDSYAEGVPCWVDVTSPSMEQTNAFYADLFGWEVNEVENAGGYTMYLLNGKYVAAGSPPPPGAAEDPPQWTTYLASDDVDATAAKIGAAGGQVFMEPFDVFDSGRMTIAADPTGATFGVWQAGNHIGAQLANEPGTLNWNECHSPDPAAAAAFYVDVFGYSLDEVDMGGPEPYRVLEVKGSGVAGVARTGEGEQPNWRTVFSVAACDDTVAQARELGGNVIAEPYDIPTVGRYSALQDPVGAVFGVLAPLA